MSTISSAELRTLAEAVESGRAAVEEQMQAAPDDAAGSLAIAQMDLRVARNALRIAADAIDGYCSVRVERLRAEGPRPPKNPQRMPLPFAHLRGTESSSNEECL